jgi:hypothetical protein
MELALIGRFMVVAAEFVGVVVLLVVIWRLYEYTRRFLE